MHGFARLTGGEFDSGESPEPTPMDSTSRPPRVAILGRVDGVVTEVLRNAPTPFDVRTFAGLYDDYAELRDFAPDVCCLAAQTFREHDLGGVRLARAELGSFRLVLVAARELESELGDLARRAGASLLLMPCTTRDVMATFDGARSEPDDESAFLDIARGLADEINNPLMFASGHLQLLEASFDPTADRDRASQCRAARKALEKIAATMRTVRTLGQVQALRPPLPRILLRDVIGDVLEAVDVPDGLDVALTDELRDAELTGDRDLLVRALGEFCRVAGEIVALGNPATLTFSRTEGGVLVRLRLVAAQLGAWETPRSFDAYYLNRVLRGSPHGLALFLVQAIVHAHGGRATAKKGKGGELELALELP